MGMKYEPQKLQLADVEQEVEVIVGLDEALMRFKQGWELLDVLSLNKFLMKKRAHEKKAEDQPFTVFSSSASFS